MAKNVIGVDVGTGSVRAGVYDSSGALLGHSVCDIAMATPQPGWAEQSSEDIWAATCEAVRHALAKAGLHPDDVSGIGFDATCSLVLTGKDGAPLLINPGASRDVILWLDHRSEADAAKINATKDRMLRTVGGVMSPEMQLPKLRWLKHNRPDTWASLDRAFDLTDWLTWKASGDDSRSLCTTVCKWAFDTDSPDHGPNGRWPARFFDQIGLADLLENHAYKIGSTIVHPATPLGNGLTAQAATALGLNVGTAVAAGLIDAHAGAAAIWMTLDDASPLEGRLAIIAGTSSCHMVLSKTPLETPGVWGPYTGAILPGLSLAEGGQSAAGIFLERLIAGHPACTQLPDSWADRYHTLDQIVLESLEQNNLDTLLASRVIVPDYAGNRSPIAQPELRGLMAGLSLEVSLQDLAETYLAGLLALANSTRQIVEALTANGHIITSICATGSGAQNALLMQLHADVLQLPLIVADGNDGVVRGAAITAFVASGQYNSLIKAMNAMRRKGEIYQPDARQSAQLQRRYTAFIALQNAGVELGKILS